jgi:hypothetical protein
MRSAQVLSCVCQVLQNPDQPDHAVEFFIPPESPVAGEGLGQHLDGDFGFSLVSVARYTAPVPPSPSLEVMR